MVRFNLNKAQIAFESAAEKKGHLLDKDINGVYVFETTRWAWTAYKELISTITELNIAVV